MSEANYETRKKIYTLAKGMHSAFAIFLLKTHLQVLYKTSNSFLINNPLFSGPD
jgi:hypothetical protein